MSQQVRVYRSLDFLAGGGSAVAEITPVSTGGVLITTAHGALSAERHTVSVVSSGTLASGAGLVGVNIAVTTAGTAGTWVSGIYAKVTQGATKNVNGYLCGAEFEVINTANNVSDNFVLVLNSNNSGGQRGQHESYIALRSYGSLAANSFLWIEDQTIGTNNTAVLISSTGAKTHSHSIRIIVDDTAYWLMVTSTGPAA